MKILRIYPGGALTIVDGSPKGQALIWGAEPTDILDASEATDADIEILSKNPNHPIKNKFPKIKDPVKVKPVDKKLK